MHIFWTAFDDKRETRRTPEKNCESEIYVNALKSILQFLVETQNYRRSI